MYSSLSFWRLILSPLDVTEVVLSGSLAHARAYHPWSVLAGQLSDYANFNYL